MTDVNHALVLFSGGQDSTTCLGWALTERFDQVSVVGFDYGQRHRVELECRQKVLETMRVMFSTQGEINDCGIIPINTLAHLGGSALVDENIPVVAPPRGLPSTFVPGRNVFFLATAAAVAQRLGARHLVGGMCETDFSGYPDCRDSSIKAIQVALSLSMEWDVVIHTPLMWRNKQQTWDLALEVGGWDFVSLIVNETHTCYHGDRTMHDWGAGCGECPACGIRKRGFDAFYGSQRRVPRHKL